MSGQGHVVPAPYESLYCDSGHPFVSSQITVVTVAVNRQFFIYPLSTPKRVIDPFRTALPLWGQTSQIPSSLFQKRDCCPERSREACHLFKRGLLLILSLGLPWSVSAPCITWTTLGLNTRFNDLCFKQQRNIRATDTFYTPWTAGFRSRGNRSVPVPIGGLLLLVVCIDWHLLKPIVAGNGNHLSSSLMYCSANLL